MTLPVETLIRPVTSDEIFEKLLEVLELVKVPARSWKPGGVARSILGAVAEVGAQGTALVASLNASGFLTLAKGIYLTSHVDDVYGEARIAATFASGEVTLTNEGGNNYNEPADTVVVRSSVTKARYRITEPVVLSAGTSDTFAIEAISPGAASSASPGEITEFETPLLRVTVTNAAAVVGTDAERDEELVPRAKMKRATWSPFGPRDAYAYAALSATMPDGTPAGITRVSVSPYSSTGTVTVVCATASGTPNEAQLEAVRTAVALVARPDTVTAIVQGAVPKVTANTVTLWCRGGVASTIRAKAQAAMTALVAGYPIGGQKKAEGGQGYFFADKVTATLLGAAAEAYDLDYVVGGSDIALAANEVVVDSTVVDVRIT